MSDCVSDGREEERSARLARDADELSLLTGEQKQAVESDASMEYF